jgi:hypothetical protein
MKIGELVELFRVVGAASDLDPVPINFMRFENGIGIGSSHSKHKLKKKKLRHGPKE